jgi:hypothetical protein
MKKTLLASLCIIAFISMSFIIDREQPGFKNLKVLPKNTNKEQMDSIMKSFSVALGVKCNFCHVRLDDEQKNWDFASDKNEHKNIARTMMRMTNDINKKYFNVANSSAVTANLEVTCYTCHNGKVHPARLPAAAKSGADSAGARRQAPDSARRQWPDSTRKQ